MTRKTSPVTLRSLTGPEIAAAIDDLAALRIAVFAEYPYLYAGDEDYEAAYLRAFAAAPAAVLVAAFAGDRIVGAATASPLAAQEPELRGPFERRGVAIDRLCYFGESVLLPLWRGQGIGHGFFDHREAWARGHKASAAIFAAVVRPPEHPARPADHVPLDAFWRRRGYAPVPGLVTELAWREHGEAEESPKPMQFWQRPL